MNGIRFLLVDDEKEFVEALARRLRQRKFAVDCAFSGREALDRLEIDEESQVDVVVLDVKMPELDGIDTLELIKRKRPLVEVLMLTGHADIQSAVEAVKFGAFDYLTKPCDLEELVSKAKQAASRKHKRESKVLEARMKPFISTRERDEMISKAMDEDE